MSEVGMRGQFCLWRVTIQSIERGVRGRPGKESREGWKESVDYL